MASALSLNLKLDSLIEGATCIDDLTPLLNSIFGLEEIKDLLKQRISTMNIQRQQNMYLKAAPMDDVLPHCILQHTIGFIEDLRDIALVNKAFHKCCDSIQRLLIKQKETDWQTEFTDLHSDFNDGRIIHVYPDPSWRHNMLQRAIQYAQSGDTLLIHEGNYEFNHAYELNENIKLIGYGPNVVVRAHYGDNESTDELVEITFNAQYLYLQNITFDMDETFCMCFQSAVGVFYMEQCVINFATAALMIRSAKTVKIKNCIFEGDLEFNSVGLDISNRPEILEIESCVFKHCCCNSGGGDDDHCIFLSEKISIEQTKFKCISNHFQNNFGLPIVAKNPSEFDMEHTQIMNNTWSYMYEVPLLRDADVDPNKIYSYTTRIERSSH
eukprot:84050_1